MITYFVCVCNLIILGITSLSLLPTSLPGTRKKLKSHGKIMEVWFPKISENYHSIDAHQSYGY